MKVTCMVEFIQEVADALKEGEMSLREHQSFDVAVQRGFGKTDALHNETFWHFREKTRVRYVYPKVEMGNQATMWEVIKNHNTYHYAHPSKQHPNMIAYTKSSEHGQKDLQTICKIGRYIKKMELYDDDTINTFANAFTQRRKADIAKMEALRTGVESDNNVLGITDDPVLIRHIYETCGTGSCMSYSADKWGIDNLHVQKNAPLKIRDYIEGLNAAGEAMHPVDLYGFSDEIAVAYYKDNGRVVARAVVNKQTKKYCRIYGNDHLKVLLNLDGYYYASSLDGFSFPVVQAVNKSGVEVMVMPYLDGEDSTCVIHNGYITDVPDVSRTLPTWATRHYSTGGIPYEGTVACSGCEYLLPNNLSTFQYNLLIADEVGTERLCTACFTDDMSIEKSDYVYAWCYDEESNHWYLRPKLREYAEKYENLIHPAASYSFITYIDGELSSQQKSRSKMLTYLYRKTTAKYSLNYVYQRDTGLVNEDVMTPCLYILPGEGALVLLPDMTTGYTTAKTGSLCGAVSKDIRKRFKTDKVLTDVNYPELDLLAVYQPYSRRWFYTNAKDCVQAVVSTAQDAAMEMRAREQCYYVMSTKQWACLDFVREHCRTQGLTRQLASEDFTEHGVAVLHAYDVVEAIHPVSWSTTSSVYSGTNTTSDINW